MQQTLAAQQLLAVQHSLSASQRQLGENLRALYKQGDVNALAVMLGSQSLDDAMSRIDRLNRIADDNRRVVSATLDARVRIHTLQASLRDRRARIDAATNNARRTVTRLASARRERASFLARLQRVEHLGTTQVASLETASQIVERRSSELQPAARAAARGSITVTTTGYSLPGRTATGMPVGYGVVAVDPAVIPLGTRVRIPGYGEGVAADTGPGVRGNTIDLWFPTVAQARAWGRRVVTIDLH